MSFFTRAIEREREGEGEGERGRRRGRREREKGKGRMTEEWEKWDEWRMKFTVRVRLHMSVCVFN